MVLDSVSSATSGGNSSSFQAGGDPKYQQQQQQHRQSDPFYLASASGNNNAGGADDVQDVASPQNQLGIIQLADSDGEDAETNISEKKSKKKKKNKKDKKLAAVSPSDMMAGDVMQAFGGATGVGGDISGGLISGMGGDTAQASAHGATTIYDSEDDDDDDIGPFGSNRNKKKATSKEFAGLSKVDITKPLREDEVITQPKHYEVPDRSLELAPMAATETKKSKKELKKERKEAKKQKKQQKSQQADSSGATGDLLDLGVFGGSSSTPAPSTAAPVSAPAAQVMGGNVISSAFDDLLGLDAPAPAPVLPTALPSDPFGAASTTPVASTMPQTSAMPISSEMQTSSSSKPSRPWMKGSIKSSSAAGSGVDWSRVNLLARVYHSKQGTMLKIRVDNIQDTVLSNLVLELNGNATALGSVAPSGSAESPKVGPFQYPSLDASHEVRGTLRLQDGSSSVPVKLLLPATMHLSPQDGLQLDQVAEELASIPFASASAKVDPSGGQSPDEVKQAIAGFLRAGMVQEGPSSNPKAATLAAVSSSGAKLRVLLKIKDSGTVKIDLRCTNPILANALASDMKKVIL